MDRIREFFANLTRNQKIGLGAGAAVVLAVAVGVAIAAGGGDDEVETTATTTSSSTTTTTAPAPVAPLTGLPQPDEAKRNRPALVVKIDNDNSKARPHAGLNQADVVVEEAVEGGVTRFAAIFQSTDSDPVGPVRSARTTDIQIIANLNRPLFAWSGANPGVAATVRSAPLVDVGFDAVPGEYYRDGDRPAPSNLFTNTSALYAAGPGGGTPPAWFEYRGEGEEVPASARSVPAVRVSFGGRVNYTSEWRWSADAGGWARTQLGTPHVDTAGTQIAPDNVVIQFTEYRDSGYVDITGAASPEAVMTGSGPVWVLTDGRLVEGEWARARPEDVTSYTDAGGNPIKLTPGRTWLVLARPDGAEVLG